MSAASWETKPSTLGALSSWRKTIPHFGKSTDVLSKKSSKESRLRPHTLSVMSVSAGAGSGAHLIQQPKSPPWQSLPRARWSRPSRPGRACGARPGASSGLRRRWGRRRPCRWRSPRGRSRWRSLQEASRRLQRPRSGWKSFSPHIGALESELALQGPATAWPTSPRCLRARSSRAWCSWCGGWGCACRRSSRNRQSRQKPVCVRRGPSRWRRHPSRADAGGPPRCAASGSCSSRRSDHDPVGRGAEGSGSTVGFQNFIAFFWDESLAWWNVDSVPPIGGTQYKFQSWNWDPGNWTFNPVPPIGGTQYKFQPWNRDSGIETLARVPEARPFPNARRLSAEWLFLLCLFHYILVCHHMFCYIMLYCAVLQNVVRNILCPTYAVFYVISCYMSLRKFWLLCYVMVSILLCFALFAYVILYVISFGSIILCYALVYYSISPYTEKSLINKIPCTEKSFIKGNPSRIRTEK